MKVIWKQVTLSKIFKIVDTRPLDHMPRIVFLQRRITDKKDEWLAEIDFLTLWDMAVNLLATVDLVEHPSIAGLKRRKEEAMSIMMQLGPREEKK